MTRTPIVRQEQYAHMLTFISLKGEVTGEEILDRIAATNDPVKRHRVSEKIQELRRKGFIKVVRKKPRGKLGHQRIYGIDYGGLIFYFVREHMHRPNVFLTMLEKLDKDDKKTLFLRFNYLITLVIQNKYAKFNQVADVSQFANFPFLKNMSLHDLFEELKDALVRKVLFDNLLGGEQTFFEAEKISRGMEKNARLQTTRDI